MTHSLIFEESWHSVALFCLWVVIAASLRASDIQLLLKPIPGNLSRHLTPYMVPNQIPGIRL